MKIITRLIWMLALTALLIGTALLLQLRSENRQTRQMLAELQEETSERLDALLGVEGRGGPEFELGHQSLSNFAADYAHWAEMASFVTSGDAAWAAANIDPDLGTFKANAAWVLRPDGTQVYGVVRQLGPALRDLPLPASALLERLRQTPHQHFFLEVPEGVLEVVSTPLEPAAPTSRPPPKGWFLVARLWDDAQLKSLSILVEGKLELLPAGVPRPTAGEGINLIRELKGWDGKVIRLLHIRYLPALLQNRLHSDESESFVVAFFGLLVVAIVFFAVLTWVIRPLRLLEQSLRDGSAEPLAALPGHNNEFARLARLAEASYQHRTWLEQEILVRKRTEEALRVSLQLRMRLARDLHDSVIQSLYATGLGIESVRQTLPEDAAAEQRLEAARASLNRTIREIRSFIADLEPEETSNRPFSAELNFLAETLSTLQPAQIKAVIAAAPEPSLSPSEQTHALQIVREAVSNALRHGQAGNITLEYRETDGRPVLEIRDDGRGFDPENPANRGNGLANMRTRAAEIRAGLAIVSAPGRGGTRIILTFRREA